MRDSSRDADLSYVFAHFRIQTLVSTWMPCEPKKRMTRIAQNTIGRGSPVKIVGTARKSVNMLLLTESSHGSNVELVNVERNTSWER